MVNKYHIVALKDRVAQGFVKSINHNKSSFTITKEKKNARTFVEYDVFDEIDKLTAYGYDKGYVFMYVPANS